MQQSSPRTTVVTDSNYDDTLRRIEAIMQKGSGALSGDESAELGHLAEAVEAYEKGRWPVKPPTTLEGILELKMYELRLKQKDLAEKLEVSNTKLSLILSGKQKPDVQFLKRVHQALKVDAGVLLAVV